MRRRKGQSAVEFALMAPIIFLMIFGMIYGGIMFMDYLNFNNQARAIAREVSLASTEKERQNLKKKYEEFKDKAAGVYAVSFRVNYDEEDVTVEVNFSRKESFIIMPQYFEITYTMKLENTDNTT